MNNVMYFNKIVELATKLHQDEFRNDGVTPYINHPHNVVNILKAAGYTVENDLDVLATAMLHDVIEEYHKKYGDDNHFNLEELIEEATNELFKDTYYIFEQTKMDFHKRIICSAVDQLTFKGTEKYAKDFYLAKIATLSCEYDDGGFTPDYNYIYHIVRIVKTANRIANTRDFIKDDNIEYAKKYLHKANAIYFRLYHDDIVDNNNYTKVKKLLSFVNEFDKTN